MLALNLEKLVRKIGDYEGHLVSAKLRFSEDRLLCALPAMIGEQCKILVSDERVIPAEVVGFSSGLTRLMPLESIEHVPVGVPVVRHSQRRTVPVGPGVLGRILDGLGRPLDGGGPLTQCNRYEVPKEAPRAFERARVSLPFTTGQKAIDALLTCGRGQRMGIFSGSGVGKSTLLGQVAKTAESDVNVIALVGERGCELRPFVEDCLGSSGLARSVVVVSTCEQLPLMRIRAVETAISIADGFRRDGANCMFFLDSLTRMAMAQRELGLSIGEPPSARGYTPSVFQLMAKTLERLGNDGVGSITAFVTVLVDGDDLDEPISDAARALLDGHIVLDRRLAERGHFPAISIAQSISRPFLNIIETSHQVAARKLRAILATHAEVEDLIRIGAYTKGANAQVDRVIDLMPAVTTFLRQELNQRFSFEETRTALDRLAALWPY